ncbi:MAG TPA: type II toxin-antitoxin system Phd/YefM family antitoxin [Protaetiibacter sp.]|nr:type II toxin-antitoxin system Phd/YefM family antitoxin [Protaetiibacter sp.]
MDVGIAAFRKDLKHYLDLAQAGEETVITDRGAPIARITSVDTCHTIDELTRAGLIAPPATKGRRGAASITRVRAERPVSPLVTEQRR